MPFNDQPSWETGPNHKNLCVLIGEYWCIAGFLYLTDRFLVASRENRVAIRPYLVLNKELIQFNEFIVQE